jgi:Na+:H+ antiporter, NhaB family
MHSAIGTALGGVATLVGEPQNLLIGKVVQWDFGTFFWNMAPVSLPVLGVGLFTCLGVERLRIFGYGEELPLTVRQIIAEHDREQSLLHDGMITARLVVQAISAGLLFAGLALHVAEVGLIGLSIIILATAFCGVIEEKRLGHAFEEALPFTALLVTFFAVVAVIHQQNLFRPVIDFVLAHDGKKQLVLMYLANGLLSSISDNVFVATVYITSIKSAFDTGLIDRNQLDLLAVAFLFLLTSALAPLIRLSYWKMLWMAVPYTLSMTSTGLLAIYLFL